MYQGIATKCLTGTVRLSYVHLDQPYSHNPGAEAKYSCTLLIPKSDAATKADIDSAIEAAAQAGVAGCWNGARPPQVKTPIYDGDGVRPNGEAFGPECRGHWVMTASSKLKPQVVHPSNIEVELAPQDVYSGMYARVTVNFFPYSNSGNRGVGCGLGNVLKIDDGEPLGGRANAANDFADFANGSARPQAPQYQPPIPQQVQTPVQQPVYQTQAPTPTPMQYQTAIDPITGLPAQAPVMGI